MGASAFEDRGLAAVGEASLLWAEHRPASFLHWVVTVKASGKKGSKAAKKSSKSSAKSTKTSKTAATKSTRAAGKTAKKTAKKAPAKAKVSKAAKKTTKKSSTKSPGKSTKTASKAKKSSSSSRGPKKTLASVAAPPPPPPVEVPELLEEAPVVAVDPPTIALNESAARQTLVELLALRGGSGDESAVADRIVERLVALGLPEDAVADDGAHERIGYGSRGNLIIKLPGRGRLQRTPRRMFSAHMDTVPLCVGAQPVLEGDWIRGRDNDKALGGDDRSGCAVLMTIARELLAKENAEIDHPPLTFVFTVQEELGLRGARHLDTAQLGRPQLCFNFDGGTPLSVVTGATGDMQVDIDIRGIASHAGVHPAAGVSAAIIQARALESLREGGWHGAIAVNNHRGTANVGVISGGSATNVVMDDLSLRAEIRSHSQVFRQKIAREWKKAFEAAAKQTRNDHGDSGSVVWDETLKYESFALSKDEQVVKTALASMEVVGLEPDTRVVDGGLDANWLVAHGLPTVTIGCGQHGIHTTSERLHVPEFYTACRIGLAVATAAV